MNFCFLKSHATFSNFRNAISVCDFVILCFCVCQGEGRGGWCWANLSKLMGVWGGSGRPADEIYIRENSRKFGRLGNIKDPGIFPSRLYTVQFESIILLNIQWNFFLSTLPTSLTLQRERVPKENIDIDQQKKSVFNIKLVFFMFQKLQNLGFWGKMGVPQKP